MTTLMREECNGDIEEIVRQVDMIFSTPEYDDYDKMMVFCIGGYTEQDLLDYLKRIGND